jgi:predicted nuclease of predicted toxin-antitoxin system
LLVDENVFPKITFHLRNLVHDVKSLREEWLNRITDDEIVQMAKKRIELISLLISTLVIS